MSRPVFLSLAIVLTIACLVGSRLSGDEPPKAEITPLPATAAAGPLSLDGKIVAITLQSDPSYGIYLRDTRLETLGPQTFLVGFGVDSGAKEWTEGRRMWVSLSDVSDIIEFESVEELQRVMEPREAAPEA